MRSLPLPLESGQSSPFALNTEEVTLYDFKARSQKAMQCPPGSFGMLALGEARSHVTGVTALKPPGWQMVQLDFQAAAGTSQRPWEGALLDHELSQVCRRLPKATSDCTCSRSPR